MKTLLTIWMLVYSSLSLGGVFGEIGGSFYEKPPNMLWWQAGYDNQFNGGDKYMRFGLEKDLNKSTKIRGSVFDLGVYSMNSKAVQDEACYGVNGASPLCGTPIEFDTSGSIKGLSLSAVLETRAKSTYGLHGEAGLTYYRQDFKIGVQDDLHWQGHLQGFGYMAGGGIRIKKTTFSCYLYNGNVGGGFNDNQYPSGIGRVVTCAMGYNS